MKYVLGKEFSFCGWEGLPFALVSKKWDRPLFLDREQFLLLWSCDAVTDIAPDELTGDVARLFAWALAEGVVSEAPEGSHLRLQSYKRYPCRFRSDVQLSLTGTCNYQCRHCFQSAPHGVLGEPTTEELLDEIDQLAACGVFNVSLTGGEPLIHRGFWEVVDRIIEKGLRLTTIYSNGSLIDQALLDGFERRGIKPSWSISFDGLGHHDHIRGVAGAEDAAINAIKLLVSNGHPVGCAYALTKRTITSFRETMKFLASLGVHSVKSGHTVPQGEWLDCPEEWLTDDEYLAFYQEYIPQYLEDGRPLNLQFEGLFMGYSDASLGKSVSQRRAEGIPEDCHDQDDDPTTFEPDASKPQRELFKLMPERELPEEEFGTCLSCGSLGTAFYVGPTGRVLPCMSLDGTPVCEQFASMREVPLHDILSKGSRFIELTGATVKDVFDHNQEECAECEHRTHCGSGCRASAIISDEHDYYGCDKRTCLICKEDWASKIRAAIAAAQPS